MSGEVEEVGVRKEGRERRGRAAPGYVEYVSMCVWRLCGRCGDDVWRVCGGCVEGV